MPNSPWIISRRVEIFIVLTCLVLMITGGVFALWRMQETTALIIEVRAELARTEKHILKQQANVEEILRNQRATSDRFGGAIESNTRAVDKATEMVKKAHDEK